MLLYFAWNNAAEREKCLKFFTVFFLTTFSTLILIYFLRTRQETLRSSDCPFEKVENALETAITRPSRGTSMVLMHFIASYLQKPKPCYFPLQEKCGPRMRKAVFLLKSFKSQRMQVGPLVKQSYFLVLCRGFRRGYLGQYQWMSREVVQILDMRTEPLHSQHQGRPSVLPRWGHVVSLLSRLETPSPLKINRESAYRCTPSAATVWLAAPFRVGN